MFSAQNLAVVPVVHHSLRRKVVSVAVVASTVSGREAPKAPLVKV